MSIPPPRRAARPGISTRAAEGVVRSSAFRDERARQKSRTPDFRTEITQHGRQSRTSSRRPRSHISATFHAAFRVRPRLVLAHPPPPPPRPRTLGRTPTPALDPDPPRRRFSVVSVETRSRAETAREATREDSRPSSPTSTPRHPRAHHPPPVAPRGTQARPPPQPRPPPPPRATPARARA